MLLDPEKSVEDYRVLAARYDHATRRINAARLRAIDALALQSGETVMDVACGSGYSFASIMHKIGPGGFLLAFDHSPELLAIARQRIAQAGWSNVMIIEAPAEAADFRPAIAQFNIMPPSALLFSYTHDILQAERALDNLIAQATPAARVALCGTRLWPRHWWPACLPVNWYLRHTHRQYITSFDNFDRPWIKLAPRLAALEVKTYWPGWRYLVTGRLR
jgi:SAM-dependent methyltransferase